MIVAAHQTMMGPQGGAAAQRCAVFDGSTSSIMQYNIGNLTTTTYPSLSASFWERIDQESTAGWPFTITSTNSNRTGVIAGITNKNATNCNARLQFSYVGDYGTYDAGAYGVWHHYAFTFDGQTPKVFLDGSQVLSGSASKWMNTNANMFISIGSRPAAVASTALVGRVANLAVYFRAITASEIASLASSFSATAGNPDHLYLFANDDGADTGTAATKWNLSTGSTTTFQDVT